MTSTYEAPRLLSLPANRDVVEDNWVATIVAGLLGVSAAIVIGVCSQCNTLGSVTDCYNTMVTWIQGGRC